MEVKFGMYTGTLIDDLIAAVERADRAAKPRSRSDDLTPDSPGGDSQNPSCELEAAETTAASAKVNQSEILRAETIPANAWSERG